MDYEVPAQRLTFFVFETAIAQSARYALITRGLDASPP